MKANAILLESILILFIIDEVVRKNVCFNMFIYLKDYRFSMADGDGRNITLLKVVFSYKKTIGHNKCKL